MPTNYLPFVTQVCYRDGLDFHGYLSWFFFNFPFTIWLLLAGVAFYSSDAYIQLLSSSYWLHLGVSVVIQESVGQLPPHPSCNNQGWGMPAWQAQIAWAYLPMMLIHRLFFTRRLSLFDVGRGLLLGVVVPIVLSVSGNYTPLQTFMGCLVGAIVGGLVITWVMVFWLPRIEFVTRQELMFNHWGFRVGAPGFYKEVPSPEAASAAADRQAEEQPADDSQRLSVPVDDNDGYATEARAAVSPPPPPASGLDRSVALVAAALMGDPTKRGKQLPVYPKPRTVHFSV